MRPLLLMALAAHLLLLATSCQAVRKPSSLAGAAATAAPPEDRSDAPFVLSDDEIEHENNNNDDAEASENMECAGGACEPAPTSPSSSKSRKRDNGMVRDAITGIWYNPSRGVSIIRKLPRNFERMSGIERQAVVDARAVDILIAKGSPEELEQRVQQLRNSINTLNRRINSCALEINAMREGFEMARSRMPTAKLSPADAKRMSEADSCILANKAYIEAFSVVLADAESGLERMSFSPPKRFKQESPDTSRSPIEPTYEEEVADQAQRRREELLYSPQKEKNIVRDWRED